MGVLNVTDNGSDIWAIARVLLSFTKLMAFLMTFMYTSGKDCCRGFEVAEPVGVFKEPSHGDPGA